MIALDQLAVIAAVALPAPFSAHSTAYCLRGRMADGTYTRAGSAASNRHRLGTRLWITGRGGPGGRRSWVVRDRIGWGSQLDFWQPSCGQALSWGRRTVRYRIGRPKFRSRVVNNS